MFFRRAVLASLAAAGVANAQQNDPCKAKSNKVQSQGDLDGLSNCRILTGDLIIGNGLVQANIDGVESIQGSLIAKNATLLQSLSAPMLNSIGGTFDLESLTVLGTLSFPSLKSVGSIYWQTLPGLQQLSFAPSEITEADKVTITDTILESLTGINLVTVGRFDINNNRYLKDITVQLTNITDSLSIEFNSPSVAASFPNLTWANNATFRSCGSVSLPLLQTVNGSLGFFENTFEDLATPKLTAVGTGTDGGDITFAKNDDLKNVSMPLLTTIYGTLQFVNDTSLDAIDGFPKLSSVHGSIDVSGKFDKCSFPSIKDIRGGFNLQTTAQFDCTNFDKLQGGIVKGSYVCSGAVTDPGTEGTTPQTNGDSGSGSKNAAGRLSATNSFAAIAALTFVAALYL